MRLLPLLLSFSLLPLAQKAGGRAASPQTTTQIATKDDADWQLTFADEFEESRLDLSRWVPHNSQEQVRDRELQAYSPESVSVNGGQLHLTARRSGNERKYTSGIVTTFGTFSQTRGRFEIRCRVPAGRGLRPGFRLLPVPEGGVPEIAVFETIGSSPSQIFFANRWGTEQTERSIADSFNAPDLSTDFHTVSLEWASDKLTWSVDGKQKFQSVDGVPYQPLYLVLDLAVGGSLAHDPDASTSLPAFFDIDYVRVYQRRGGPDR